MRFITALYIAFCLSTAPRAHAEEFPSGEPAATIDLATTDGVRSVNGAWRYSDVAILQTRHRTWDIEPHAGMASFDDSSWPVISAESLDERRGPGRLSFNWYRITITIPSRIGSFDPAGSTVTLETSVDDYAEVWVDGELPRAAAQSGGSVIKGWNAVNRLVVGRNVKPGQKIAIAVFGINGPISDPPTNFIWMRLAKLAFYPGSTVPLAVPPQEVNVRIVRNDAAIDSIVPVNAKIYKLAEGFQFTEGPIWIEDGGYLLFSDPNANRIYAYSEATASLSLFREKSGYDGADIAEYGQPGSNGLTLDKQGRLTIDQHGNHRVVRVENDGQLTVLADKYQGKRLNSPNDLVYKSDGAVYFTDPPFGLPRFFDDPRKELPFSGVYRALNGKLTLLTKELKGPNGLVFSPDEKYFYVDNWDPERKVVLRFPVKRDGTLGTSEVFADLTDEVPGEEALDGLKVDKLGNLYVSAPDGVRIYSPAGKHLGTIVAPRPIHNFAWGGADGKTLYLCGRDRLYRIALLVEGVHP